MTRDEQIEEQLERYSLTPDAKYAVEIREVIYKEIANDEREDNEILKVCCMQLFYIGDVKDSLLIWDAKKSDWDAYAYLDIQYTCGAGLQETKDFLVEQNTSESKDLLDYLLSCEKSGNFDGFSVESQINEHHRYFYGKS